MDGMGASSNLLTPQDMGKSKRQKTVEYTRYGYLFILPFFLVYFTFQLYPLLSTFYLSFMDAYKKGSEPYGPVYCGLKNYVYALTNARVRGAFFNTVFMWVVNFIPQILLALLLAAWFTDVRIKVKAQGAFKVLLFMPNIITAASIAMLFQSLFNTPDGSVQVLFRNLGLLEQGKYIDFFRSALATRLIVSFINFWMWYGNTMILLIAGILGINPSLIEAAMVDGANSKQIFWMIIFPSIRPIMLYTLVTSLIGGLQMFDIPMLLHPANDSGPDYKTESITVYIYKQAFRGGNNYGRSAAVSVLLFLITAILSIIMFTLMKERKPKTKKRGIRA